VNVGPLRTRLAGGRIAAEVVVASSPTPTIARIAASRGSYWLLVD